MVARSRLAAFLIGLVSLLAAPSGVDTKLDGMRFQLFGTPESEIVRDMEIRESGAIYVVGTSDGDLGGHSNSGHSDAFVAKFDAAGERSWLRLFGSSETERVRGMSTDRSGDVYVVGSTRGEFAGETNHGGYNDAFVAKFDSSGERQWVDLLGTPDVDGASEVVCDGRGGVYVVGGTKGEFEGTTSAGSTDVFVAKYDRAGEREWLDLFGGGGIDNPDAVVADDSGYLYVAGGTDAAIDDARHRGSYDIFLAVYDWSGHREDLRIVGTSERDVPAGLALDGRGHLYLSGETRGTLGGSNQGLSDGFVAKFRIWKTLDAGRLLEAVVSERGSGDALTARLGERLWVRTIGSPKWDDSLRVAIDDAGDVVVGGDTKGAVDGARHYGKGDAFVATFTASGERQMLRQFGTERADSLAGLAASRDGTIVVSGHSKGDLGGTNRGIWDLYLGWVER